MKQAFILSPAGAFRKGVHVSKIGLGTRFSVAKVLPRGQGLVTILLCFFFNAKFRSGKSEPVWSYLHIRHKALRMSLTRVSLRGMEQQTLEADNTHATVFGV